MKLSNLTDKRNLLLLMTVMLFVFSCSSDKKTAEETTETTAVVVETPPEHGVGPVTEVDMSGDIDQALVEKGKTIFEGKCTACHKFDERYVGPALGGVTERRNPAWIMNMIMVPEEMTKGDPLAKALLAEYMTQMVNQNVTEDDARALLEYFRSQDQNL